MIRVENVERVSVDLTRHQDQTLELIDRFVAGVVQSAFNEVQSGGRFSPGTPVDTGFARSNWQQEPANPKAGGIAVLSNDTPYIRRLEHGSSKQAPQGFVRLVVANAEPLVEEVARHVFGAAHA